MVQAPARDARTISSLAWVILALLLPLPWIASVAGGAAERMAPQVVAIFSGIAIVGAAFLLSWGAELAERDISQNLALVSRSRGSRERGPNTWSTRSPT